MNLKSYQHRRIYFFDFIAANQSYLSFLYPRTMKNTFLRRVRQNEPQQVCRIKKSRMRVIFDTSTTFVDFACSYFCQTTTIHDFNLQNLPDKIYNPRMSRNQVLRGSQYKQYSSWSSMDDEDDDDTIWFFFASLSSSPLCPCSTL